MKIEILHEAEEELSEAVAYYEGIESGLGVRLKEEVRMVIHWIATILKFHAFAQRDTGGLT